MFAGCCVWLAGPKKKEKEFGRTKFTTQMPLSRVTHHEYFFYHSAARWRTSSWAVSRATGGTTRVRAMTHIRPCTCCLRAPTVDREIPWWCGRPTGVPHHLRPAVSSPSTHKSHTSNSMESACKDLSKAYLQCRMDKVSSQSNHRARWLLLRVPSPSKHPIT